MPWQLDQMRRNEPCLLHVYVRVAAPDAGRRMQDIGCGHQAKTRAKTRGMGGV